MNASEMMEAIGNTLTDGEEVEIDVTYARGRTMVLHHTVTTDGAKCTRRSWDGTGNLRDEYKRRVVDTRETASV